MLAKIGFYFEVALLVFVAMVELNPKRFRGTKVYKSIDKNSGPLLALAPVLVGLVSALAFIFKSFWGLLACGVLLLTVVYRIFVEEKYLAATNPDYVSYMRQTSRLIPFIY